LEEEGFDQHNLEHRKLLHTLLMICAELSDYAKPFLHCRDIAVNIKIMISLVIIYCIFFFFLKKEQFNKVWYVTKSNISFNIEFQEQTYNDFFNQGDLSHAEGVFDDLTEFNKKQMKIPPLQINFIDTICIPVFQ
jgi:hypothetical protein